jgi:uncharacterized membrane protein
MDGLTPYAGQNAGAPVVTREAVRPERETRRAGEHAGGGKLQCRTRGDATSADERLGHQQVGNELKGDETMSKRLTGAVTLLVAASLTGKPVHVQGQTGGCAIPGSYQVSELPGIGGPLTQSLALNDLGQAAGRALDAAWRSRAVAWTGGTVRNLSGSATAEAYGISSDGRVAGWHITLSRTRAAVWFGSTVTTLAPLAGQIASIGSDVNRSGNVVGWSTNSVGDTTAVEWRNGQARNLAAAVRPRPSISLAFANNDANQIVGRGDFSTPPFRRALVWDAAGARSLADLGSGYGGASGNSGDGKIAGASLSPNDSKYHGVMWVNGSIVDLGLLDGFFPTSAYGVNNCGTAVGDAVIEFVEGDTVAVVWNWDDRIARELNQLGPAAAG